MPILRDRLHRGVQDFLVALARERGAGFDAAVTLEMREEVNRFADRYFEVPKDVASEAVFAERAAAWLREYQEDWEEKTEGRKMDDVLASESPGALLAQTLVLLLAPSIEDIAESDAEVLRELAACERAVADAGR